MARRKHSYKDAAVQVQTTLLPAIRNSDAFNSDAFGFDVVLPSDAA